jgi:hypothetical protein
MAEKKKGVTKPPSVSFKDFIKNMLKPIQSPKDQPTNIHQRKLAKKVDK